jgi:hypothetical protein
MTFVLGNSQTIRDIYRVVLLFIHSPLYTGFLFSAKAFSPSRRSWLSVTWWYNYPSMASPTSREASDPEFNAFLALLTPIGP